MTTHFSGGVSVGGAPLTPSGSVFSGNSRSFYVDAVNGNDGNPGTSPDKAVKTIAMGYAKLTANRNDTLYVIGTTAFANLSAALVWAKDYTHLVGVCAPVQMNQRARIGFSANFTPGITISATGCSFRNLYISYGRGNAGNLVAVKVTGARNYFENVHFAGPMHATEAGTAGYMTVQLSGAQECTFRECSFGITTIARSAANALITFDTSAGRCHFIDCNLLSMSSATTPVMVNNTAVDGIVDYVMFKGCQFLNFSANWATLLAAGVKNAGTNSGGIILQDCMFTGITAIGAVGNLLRTFVLGNESGTAANQGLAVNP